MELSDDPLRLQESAIAFARQALAHDVIAADAAETFNRDAWRQCADFGVLGMPIPKEYGGLGLGLSSLLAVMEGLGYGTRDQGLLFSLNAHLWTNSIPILQLRHRGAAREVPAGALRRQPHRRQRGQRARRRLGHLQHADARRARRRRTTCSTARRCSSPTRRSPTCSSPTRRSIRRWA